MSLPPLILASASPRRSELLAALHLPFRVIPSDAAEIHEAQLTARELAQLNAYRKARAVAKRYPDSLVLGADTLVYMGTELFGKPRDLPEARRMLARLQHNSHEVVTGICMVHLRAHQERLLVESTVVRFKPLSHEAIDQYLHSINPLDKAGGYAIQEGGEVLVESLVGSYSNVVGLPVERLKTELERWSSDQSPAR
ncbi:MAG: Maf family protein [Verrucomicrobiota bacterium]